MIVVHAADLHLDSPLRGLDRYEGAPVDAVRSATRRAFEALVERCAEERAALLLLAGDVFDGDWKDFSTGLFFRAGLVRLVEGGTRVVLLRGNHDAQSAISRKLTWPDGVRELAADRAESVVFDDLGVAVHGRSFPSRAVPQDLAAAYPDAARGYANFGLLHTSLDGRPHHANYAPTTLETLRSKGYDYWALGHVHTREVVAREPWVVFPGNLQGRHARETGPKGATAIRLEKGAVAEVEPWVLDVLRWEAVEIDATGAPDLDALLPEVARGLGAARAAAERPLAVRLRVRATPTLRERLERQAERTAGELRGLANDLEDVWIERVEWLAPLVPAAAPRLEDGDARAALQAALEAFRHDDAAAAELAAQLVDLKAKLPPDLRQGPDGLAVDDPTWLRGIVDDVEALLAARLQPGDG